MRFPLLFLAVVPALAGAQAPRTADELIARYVQKIGGIEKIRAVQSLRRTGKLTGGGGFEATVLQESKRPNKVREEFSLQGMTGVTAYDGHAGWKIEPWQGKKDPEALSEDELRSVVEESDFDDPLIDYAAKGNTATLVGMDQVDGSDVYKLKLTLKSGDVRIYDFDADELVPIKIESKRTIRGAEVEFETELGDYKEVNGWYLPFSMATGAKGSQFKQAVTLTKIEANVPIDDKRFEKPATGGAN